MTKDVFKESRYGRLHLRVTGEGRPLFLMHSVARSGQEFDALATELQNEFRVVAWDMPGHGDSDPILRHITVSAYADLAADLIKDMFGENKPIVGGSSFGAMLSLALGARHPDAAVAILPIEMPLGRDEAWWRANWSMVETLFGLPDEDEERTRARFRKWSPELAMRLRLDRFRAGPRAIMDVLWAGREESDGVPGWVRSLRMPTLFVNGDRGVAPKARELLADFNPAVRLTMIGDSGHFPQTDDPVAVAAAIRDWATTIG
jgi:pimeloyl-ACP methyl ester carboxylesterase